MKKHLCGCLCVLFFATINLFGQQQLKIITGKVTNAANAPLEGVSVLIKNSKAATVTRKNGTFSIQASEQDTLVFTYIGYANRSAFVGSKTTLDITLAEGASDLSDVVVTVVNIGYG